MPSRLTDERARAIARYYCENGFNKTNALRSVTKADGSQYYSDKYCNTTGHKLYSNARVKAEIDRVTAVTVATSKLTVDIVLADLEYGVAASKKKGDLNALARFSELRGKHLAMYTDKYADASDHKPPELSDAEREQLRKAAIVLVSGKEAV